MKTVEINPVRIPEAIIPETNNKTSLIWKQALLVFGAAGSFHLAFASPFAPGAVILYAACLIKMADVPSARIAFRSGFTAGLLIFAPHLAWFWAIFGPVAICLWSILSFFTGGFALILSQTRGYGKAWPLLAGVVWTGLEYFRGELYYLKFSWLAAGFTFSGDAGLIPTSSLGMYGLGLLFFSLAGACLLLPRPWPFRAAIAAALALSVLASIPAPASSTDEAGQVQVAGIQLEFPPALAVPGYLDRVLEENPGAEILVLSEYTFDATVPVFVREWCRTHRRYLVAGGKDDSLGNAEFYNTAFVVSPDGEIVFQQAKSVPIQFFRDGKPAPKRKLWNSPWGKIAIPTCYDLSYRSVMDDFVRQGAQAIIVPFMDVAGWGAYQHELHARVAPMRAREYRVPIFRLGSSGISQHVASGGRVVAAEGYPGQEEILAGTLHLSGRPNLPLDHWLAPVCSGVTGLLLLLGSLVRARRSRP